MRSPGFKNKGYRSIISHYEKCLQRHGDNHLGVDWPSATGAEQRYKVMIEAIRPNSSDQVSLLDFGCGASHLYEYILRQNLESRIDYSGLDLSDKFLALSRKKFPRVRYYEVDLLEDDSALPEFDYIIMNGVFTERQDLPYGEMMKYFQKLINLVFQKARIGVAFNVMSKQVEWERDDLFHVPFDSLASFLTKTLSRHFVIRHDYGLYEYTVYAYRS